jgi:hypothetical protein
MILVSCYMSRATEDLKYPRVSVLPLVHRKHEASNILQAVFFGRKSCLSVS